MVLLELLPLLGLCGETKSTTSAGRRQSARRSPPPGAAVTPGAYSRMALEIHGLKPCRPDPHPGACQERTLDGLLKGMLEISGSWRLRCVRDVVASGACGSSKMSRSARAQYTRLRLAPPTSATISADSSRSIARWAVVKATSSRLANPLTVRNGFSANISITSPADG